MQKSISVMNSSTRKADGDLARRPSSSRAKKFLEGLANLNDGDSGFRWFQSNFPYVLEDARAAVGSVIQSWAVDTEEEDYKERPFPELLHKYWLLPLRETVRAIWRAPDIRTKQWGVFRISQDFFLQGDPSLSHVPLANTADLYLQLKPPRPTERLLLEIIRWSELTCCCSNPDCVTPYFIASRRGQKYCTAECSKPAQREFKRKWWAEKGRFRRSRSAASRLRRKA